MNKTVFAIIGFIAGAATGSLITYKVMNTRYERTIDERVHEELEDTRRELKEVIRAQRLANGEEEPQQTARKKSEALDKAPAQTESYKVDFTPAEKIEYFRLAGQYSGQDEDEEDEDITHKYDNITIHTYVKEEDDEGRGENDIPVLPYVISDDDFSASPIGYFHQPLDYFKDGTLADSWGVPLEIDDTIGEDALNHFGEYVDDVVYVRNEQKGIDYEVTRDPRTYRDAVVTNPNPYYGHYGERV